MDAFNDVVNLIIQIRTNNPNMLSRTELRQQADEFPFVDFPMRLEDTERIRKEFGPRIPRTSNLWDAAKLGVLKDVIYWMERDPRDRLKPTSKNDNPLYTAIAHTRMSVIHYLWTEITARYAKQSKLFKPHQWLMFNKPNDLSNVQKKLQMGADNDYTSKAKRSLLGQMILLGASNGHLKLVEYALANGCSINFSAKSKKSALIIASIYGHAEIADLLIKNGASINHKDFEGRTPLSHAAEREDSKIIQLLADAGANPNLEDAKERTPLLFAIQKHRPQIVKQLIDAGSDVNFEGPMVKSPLCYALCECRSLEVIQLLIDAGADVNHFDKLLRTPFHWAATKGDIAKAKLLLDNQALVYINGYPNNYSDASLAVRDYKDYRERYFSSTPDL